jgi:hypothetical protein
MEIHASLMAYGPYHELLARIDVARDEFEAWGSDGIKRTTEGTIRERGPLWDKFFELWQRIGNFHEEKGKRYLTCNTVELNGRMVHGFSGIWHNGRDISIITMDSWYGTVDEYKDMIREEHDKLVEFREKLQTAQTRNDLRELSGFERLKIPFLDQPIPASELANIKRHFIGRLR